MRKYVLLCIGILFLSPATGGFADVIDASGLVGQGAPDFSLPSQQGNVIQYKRDYYGKYNLVLTFFPAAFTPV